MSVLNSLLLRIKCGSIWKGKVAEVHGTIYSLQCTVPCYDSVGAADEFIPEVDESSGTLTNSPPSCPYCGKLARPNILMFGDYTWVEKYSEQQLARLDSWIPLVERLVVVELGAGRALPTVRRLSERHGPRVIRINPRENAISPAHGIGIACGAKEALQRIEDQLNRFA